MTTLQMAILIFLLPVVGFTIMALTNKHLPRRGDWLATGIMGVALLAALEVFRRAWGSENLLMANWTFDWLPMSIGQTLRGGVMIDRLTAVMLVVVTTISFLVHLFSLKYMEGDAKYGRYYSSLQLFSASMLGLVLVNNMLFLFIFWELVGLSSYLLIGHFFEKKSASNAAIKAFITTRVGDVGMFIGMMICFWQVGSLQFADLFAAVETGELAGHWRTWAGLGIFFGAMGKSAQFPLHVWLPDAMEGPTPVSALIHAATMVAAGVYLVGRTLPLFDAPTLLFIAYIGGFTALVRRHHRPGSGRHQKSAGLLDRQPAGLYGLGAGGGRLRLGPFPPDHARLFQSRPLPGFGRDHPRHAPRTIDEQIRVACGAKCPRPPFAI